MVLARWGTAAPKGLEVTGADLACNKELGTDDVALAFEQQISMYRTHSEAIIRTFHRQVYNSVFDLTQV